MDKREALKSMLNNFINDKSEEASIDLHNYLVAKMRELTELKAGGGDKAGDEDEVATA